MSENITDYIYLLQEREFIKSKENVYKVGMTQKENCKRFNQYPKGSVLLFQMICNNCKNLEKQIINLFKENFTHRKDIGNEYFEGECKSMIDMIYLTIKNEEYCVKDANKEKSNEENVIGHKFVNKILPTPSPAFLNLCDFIKTHLENCVNNQPKKTDNKPITLEEFRSEFNVYCRNNSYPLFKETPTAFTKLCKKAGLVCKESHGKNKIWGKAWISMKERQVNKSSLNHINSILPC